jgi:hypothetical protein
MPPIRVHFSEKSKSRTRRPRNHASHPEVGAPRVSGCNQTGAWRAASGEWTVCKLWPIDAQFFANYMKTMLDLAKMQVAYERGDMPDQ